MSVFQGQGHITVILQVLQVDLVVKKRLILLPRTKVDSKKKTQTCTAREGERERAREKYETRHRIFIVQSFFLGRCKSQVSCNT
jgi:hypothetical protein